MEKNAESSTETYTLPCVNQLVGSCCVTQGAHPMLCDHLEGWDGKEVAGRFKKGTCVDLWPIHVVWQKLTKHCKAIILQF